MRDLRHLYYQMLRIRMVEEAIAREYPKQEMRCPTHLCIGQEAIAVGVCANLKKEDVVFSTHRSHGHYLAKGGSLKAMIAELYGKSTGCSGGVGGSMHLVDLSANFLGAAPIVASTIPVAVGAAFARTMQKKPGIAVCFFGDAAVEEGTAHEAFNFAVLQRLPVLFVCENNLYSTVTNIRDRQPRRPIAYLAAGHGMRARTVDGQDARVVYKAANTFVGLLRRGKGPGFLECLTYRFLEHCGPREDGPALRPAGELARWKKNDPVARLALVCKEKDVSAMKEKINKEIRDAFAFAKISPNPTVNVHDERLIYQ
ncbi:thiamine pyrophosphate-dependent dehydrogenase E1 component subunit alpha [Candidatus Gottesmanbacteria bacterium]|nr:thiamine pyrophosphate-dependent dehydrogenase E1 component subunit alpha [Candidatus Gottesmanbacteria bacterium]